MDILDDMGVRKLSAKVFQFCLEGTNCCASEGNPVGKSSSACSDMIKICIRALRVTKPFVRRTVLTVSVSLHFVHSLQI